MIKVRDLGRPEIACSCGFLFCFGCSREVPHGACTPRMHTAQLTHTPVSHLVRVRARVDPSHTRGRRTPLPRTSLPLPPTTLRLPCGYPAAGALPGELRAARRLGGQERERREHGPVDAGAHQALPQVPRARREERRLQLDLVPLRAPVLLLLPAHRAEPPQRRVQRAALGRGGGRQVGAGVLHALLRPVARPLRVAEARGPAARAGARADGRAHALRGGAARALRGAAPGRGRRGPRELQAAIYPPPSSARPAPRHPHSASAPASPDLRARVGCRRVLKHTYPRAFYMARGAEKELFEDLQAPPA